MSRLEQLYQEVILDHNKHPRNFHRIDGCTHSSHGVNPLCGDDYWIDVVVEDNKIVDVAFEGSGCAISKASASLMTQHVTGKSLSEAVVMKEAFIQLLTQDTAPTNHTALGRLTILEGVKKFPVRVKCATLIWRAFEDAIESHTGQVSTEKE
jgi:nitrogen fixation protein NifU and related proteins